MGIEVATGANGLVLNISVFPSITHEFKWHVISITWGTVL